MGSFFSYILCSILSMVFCILAIKTKKIHMSFSSRGHDGTEVQSLHINPTPRLGGLCIYLALIISYFLFSFSYEKEIFFQLLFSSIIIFSFGLADDLIGDIKPKWRLLGAILSSSIMIGISGYWLVNISSEFIEPLLKITMVAIIFTIFSTTGISHSINLVDGLNGLSSLIIISICCSIFSVTISINDNFLSEVCLVIIFSTFGFMIFNFPFCKIFLGDSGAYTLGYLLSWIAIILIHRNPEISAWSILLCFFWPVMETLFSIFRRFFQGASSMKADRMHIHHLVYEIISRRLVNITDERLRNSISTLALSPFILLPPFLSYNLLYNSYSSILSILTLSILYVLLYFYLYKKLKISQKI